MIGWRQRPSGFPAVNTWQPLEYYYPCLTQQCWCHCLLHCQRIFMRCSIQSIRSSPSNLGSHTLPQLKGNCSHHYEDRCLGNPEHSLAAGSIAAAGGRVSNHHSLPENRLSPDQILARDFFKHTHSPLAHTRATISKRGSGLMGLHPAAGKGMAV